MEPKRRPIGMPMEMMNAVVDYQSDDRLAPLESATNQIEFAKKRILQRERRLEKTTNHVMEQLKEKVEKFGEIESAQKEMAEKKPFAAIDMQIPNLEQALDEQKNMYAVAVRSLEVTRVQLRHTKQQHLELSFKVQDLQQKVKAKREKPHPFLEEFKNKSSGYAADPNHHRYDKYKNQSSYENYQRSKK